MDKSLEQIKKSIEDAQTLKIRATERVLSIRQQYSDKVEELKKLGIDNPKEIEKEIKLRTNEIENLKEEINNLIPTDLIKKYSNGFASQKEEGPDFNQAF